MITRRSFFAAGGGALVLAGCAGEPVTADGRFPIMDVLGILPEVSDFRSALRSAGLNELLSGPGPFTVFAPTNLAWSQAPASFRDGGANSLRSLIAGGRLRLPDITARDGRVRTLSGMEIRIVGGSPTEPRIQAARLGAQPSGASATVVRSNLLCSNGVIHVVGGVLIPA
ncbi:fasciclin domain-containing protein [Roseomonas terrae]|uniref:Fasciclin domain-containing protein n=1 Tax=Neoroseomonas terrae TaxID=424799 RepID=A0ABS5EFG5_9PROT|nr:fasciclin domain-containing protein [Neoroseomonas terrae]